MDLCFMGEMRETLVDVTEAFQTQFEEKRLPVLQVTKFDMIGDAKDTTQVRKYTIHEINRLLGWLVLAYDAINSPWNENQPAFGGFFI